jgi:hypothetical protein
VKTGGMPVKPWLIINSLMKHLGGRQLSLASSEPLNDESRRNRQLYLERCGFDPRLVQACGKYQDIILSLTVLRRLECVLAPTKQKVLKRQAELRGKGLQDLGAQLKRRKFGRQVVKIEVGRGAVSSAQLRNHSAAIPRRWRRQD